MRAEGHGLGAPDKPLTASEMGKQPDKEGSQSSGAQTALEEECGALRAELRQARAQLIASAERLSAIERSWTARERELQRRLAGLLQHAGDAASRPVATARIGDVQRLQGHNEDLLIIQSTLCQRIRELSPLPY